MLRLPALALGLTACHEYEFKKEAEPRTAAEDSDPVPRDSQPSDPPPADTDEPNVDSGHATDIGDPIDVVLLIDIAYWYDCYHPDLATNAPALIQALFDTGEDMAVAIGTYDDYNVDGEWWPAYGGRPYDLVQQLTTDAAAAKAVAASLEMVWGGDGPGTGYEALLQASAGIGYDQACDAAYSSETDILPFHATSADAFGGVTSGLYDGTVEGSGSTPGVGFRSGSRRVIVLFAENAIRDRAYDHEVPSAACLGAAGRTDAVEAMREVDAQFLGVNTYEYQDEDPTLQEQLEATADQRGSRIDADGDGAEDDLAVLSGSWDWPPVGQVVGAILDLVD